MEEESSRRDGQTDGQSDDLSAQRERMVREHLIRRGITDQRVIEAMRRTPREAFVPPHLRDLAYADRPLPIGAEQTISQPYTVAFMAQALQLTGDERVLEIGAGSGYAAAVLALLSSHVDTVERIPELAVAARGRLQRLGYENVAVHQADGTLGLPDEAPFDAMVVAAGAGEIPAPYIEQLAPNGGRLVMPVGGRSAQMMLRVTREGGALKEEKLGSFAFVPLIGRYGWKQDERK